VVGSLEFLVGGPGQVEVAHRPSPLQGDAVVGNQSSLASGVPVIDDATRDDSGKGGLEVGPTLRDGLAVELRFAELVNRAVGQNGASPPPLELAVVPVERNLDVGEVTTLVGQDLRSQVIRRLHLGAEVLVPVRFLDEDHAVLDARRGIGLDGDLGLGHGGRTGADLATLFLCAQRVRRHE